MRGRVLMTMLALGAGCSKKADPPAAQVTADASAARRQPAAIDAAPAPAGPKTYQLATGGVSVAVTLTPPDGWHEQLDGESGLSLTDRSSTRVQISLTCQGMCGSPARLAANVVETAHEGVAFLTDSSHVPQLDPIWVQRVAEVSPGTFRHAYGGKTVDKVTRPDWEEHHVVVSRVVGDRLLVCDAQVFGDKPTGLEQVAQLCDGLSMTPAPAPSGTPAELALPYQLPKVGTTWTERVESTVVIPDPDGEGDLTRIGALRRTVEVLDHAANAVSRAKVTFHEHRVQMIGGADAPTPDSPIAGKSYLVEAKGGAITVTGADGAAASPAEIAAVQESLDDFGEPDVIGMVLARTFEPGAAVAIPPEELATAQPIGKDPITGLTATLVAADDATAVLDVAWRVAAIGDLPMDAVLRLDRATGVVRGITVSGRFSLDRGTGAMHVARNRE